MNPDSEEFWDVNRPQNNHAVDTICVAPWVSMEFDPSGWVTACCAGSQYPLGHVGTDALVDMWGGSRAEVLREALGRHDMSVACGACRWHLEFGRSDPSAAVYDRYLLKEANPAWPYVMVFALSNRCNLACVMCNPGLSSRVRQEAGMAPLPKVYGDDYFAQLEPFLPHLGLAKFLGGEPFLAVENKRVWNLMDQLDSPPRMQVTTNGTIWNDYVEGVLDRFSIDISISIDAHRPSTYADVRRGGSLDVVHDNMRRFGDVCRAKGTDLHVSYCLMNRNWEELPEFLVWAADLSGPASVNLVLDPGLVLHAEPLESLRQVQASWVASDRHHGGAFGLNAGVWRTQLMQLEAVIEERSRGGDARQHQDYPVPPGLFSSSDTPSTAPATTFINRARSWARRSTGPSPIEREVARLRAWGTGDVGVVEVDSEGMITSVRTDHARLGVSRASWGQRHVNDVPSMFERADGRTCWMVDVETVGDTTVRTLVLSADRPVRGCQGSIVRTIDLPGRPRVLRVAEDRIYDMPETSGPGAPELRSPAAVPVQLGAPESSR